jgi:hypothetical protein
VPSLEYVLRDYDLGLLKIIAERWGVELRAPTQREAAEEIAAQMLQPPLVREIVDALPPEACAALAVIQREGRQPLAQFARNYGELRAMGPARRDREQPWLNSPSLTETLWYRGLIARAFFDDGHGPQEFFFIPDDLRPLIPIRTTAPQIPPPPGHPAPSPAAYHSSLDLAPDDAATLLAYLQIVAVRLEGASFPPKHRDSLGRFLRQPAALEFFTHLVIHLSLVSGSPLKLEPARARPFLESARPAQVGALAEAWRDSREWNDLLRVPGLVFEGKAWRNDPLTTRAALLNLLAHVPPGEWWSLDSFVAAVKERQPDFQRPAGDYDSWYIRDAATQTYLRGFESWERVDGALIRWMIEQPMYWLGLMELAPPPQPPAPFRGSPVREERGQGRGQVSPSPVWEFSDGGRGWGMGVAFRLTPYGAAFLGRGEWPAVEAEAPAELQIGGDGLLRVPAAASRYDRFQVARVSNWLPPEGGDYVYRLAPASLARAARQGIRAHHIVAFLQKASGGAELPPALIGALQRWERAGGEAALKDTLVLKVKNPALLETLRRTPKIRRYLGEALGPEAVEVRREDVDQLRAALAEVGILVD